MNRRAGAGARATGFNIQKQDLFFLVCLQTSRINRGIAFRALSWCKSVKKSCVRDLVTDRAQTLEIRNERKKGHMQRHLHDSLIYIVLHHMHFVQGKCSDDNLMRKFIEWMITVLRMIQHSYQAHRQSQYTFCSITELNSASTPDWSEDFSASLCQDEQTPVLTSCSCPIFCGELFFIRHSARSSESIPSAKPREIIFHNFWASNNSLSCIFRL